MTAYNTQNSQDHEKRQPIKPAIQKILACYRPPPVEAVSRILLAVLGTSV